mmetsp:Transcript_36373/g.112529  ORF Transcript_36373/g.112529 Transcript_36373/m.112529 type:complete len:217 (+) Transcript_36373:2-652(+)
MGLAHVACLVRQAETSVKEKEAWNTGEGAGKWQKCFDCGQEFHGVVKFALGWACWKTYRGRPETDYMYACGLSILGTGMLFGTDSPNEALPILLASLAVERRYWSRESESHNVRIAQHNLSGCYSALGRHEDALRVIQEVFAADVNAHGPGHEYTLSSAVQLSLQLGHLKRFAEAKSFLSEQVPIAQQALGVDHSVTLNMGHCHQLRSRRHQRRRQ